MKKVDSIVMFSVHRLALFALIVTSTSLSYAQTFPQNFSQVAVVSGISNPTVMAFAPDGRIFVAQQNGILSVIKNGVKLTTPAIQLTVNSSGERGLIGITLHPSFSTNGFVYLYYTLSNGSRNRISRFTMSGDVISPSSELIILDLDPLSGATNHNGGAMHFKGDKLYIAIGENANGAHAQNLDTYHGKLLRVNADGSAPVDNPFNVAGATEQRKRVWSYGLRNPYTFDVQPVTERVFVNDVGQNTWEEIDDATTGGLNFGWPTTEGSTTNPAFASPVFSYQHGSGDGRGCAITGGVFFNPASTNYPSSFTGKYFYQDLCNAWINYIDLSSGVVRNAFATGLPGQSLALDVGVDGNLYYLSRSAGTLYRIIFTGNQSPAITDQPDNVTVSQGQPATFQVSATGTAPLSYQWRKEGVNIAGATSATYTISSAQSSDAGNYQVVVTNGAGSVVSQIATLTVTSFNAPPTATITLPPSGTLYRGGDVINFSGTATDPEDGTLPASAFSWSVVFHHGTHVHDGPPVAQGVSSGSFTIPNSGETAADVFYTLHLLVTDSQGLSGTATVAINPRTTTITLNSNPAGLSVTLDGQPVTTPFSVLGVEGIQRTLGVVSPQTVNGVTYTFSSWSHGGTATQTIITPEANTTYTANYSASNALPSPWLTTNIGNVGVAGSASFNNGTFTVGGSGNDIWNAADAFRYVYQPLSGNMEIRARVTGMTNTNSWAKAGVMIRETLTSNSKHAMVTVTPGNGVAFQRRTSTGGASTHTASTGTAPHWVRLVRAGNIFTAYRSTNGTTWTQIGTATISMAATVFVGLPVTSHNNSALCTATFTNVTVTGASRPATAAVSANEREESSRSITVFPNPLQEDVLNIESTLTSLSPVRIQVVNIFGQVVLEKALEKQEATKLQYKVDLSGLSKGTYIVRVLSGDRNQSTILIKR